MFLFVGWSTDAFRIMILVVSMADRGHQFLFHVPLFIHFRKKKPVTYSAVRNVLRSQLRGKTLRVNIKLLNFLVEFIDYHHYEI